MEAQRQRARADRGAMEDESWKEDPLSSLDESIASTFDGYENLNVCGRVTAIVKEDEIVSTINEG